MVGRKTASIVAFLFLGATVFAVSVLDTPLWVSAIVSSIVAVGPSVITKFEDWVNQIYETQKDKRVIKSHLKVLGNHLSELKITKSGKADLSALVDNIYSSNQTYSFVWVVDQAISEIFDGMTPEMRKNLLIIIFSMEIERSDDFRKESILRDRNDTLLSDYNLNEPSNKEKKLVSGYLRWKSNTEDSISLNEFFNIDLADNEVIEYGIEISKSYSNPDNFAFSLLNDKRKAEEFRETLAKLVARGKLKMKGVEKDIESIKENIEDQKAGKTKFMVFGQKIQRIDEVKDSIEKHPHFKMGRKYPDSGFPEDIEYMSIYVVYPDKEFGSAQDFLEKEIERNIPEDYDDGGFMAVMPLELEDMKIAPDIDVIESSQPDSYESLKFLTTGFSEDPVKLISQQLTTEIKVPELLASIPFNVLAPDMKEEEKEFIIDNYEDIRERFRITELFDWADKNREELGNYLYELDENEVADEKRWHEISSTIIGEANECSEAALGMAQKT